MINQNKQARSGEWGESPDQNITIAPVSLQGHGSCYFRSAWLVMHWFFARTSDSELGLHIIENVIILPNNACPGSAALSQQNWSNSFGKHLSSFPILQTYHPASFMYLGRSARLNIQRRCWLLYAPVVADTIDFILRE